MDIFRNLYDSRDLCNSIFSCGSWNCTLVLLLSMLKLMTRATINEIMANFLFMSFSFISLSLPIVATFHKMLQKKSAEKNLSGFAYFESSSFLFVSSSLSSINSSGIVCSNSSRFSLSSSLDSSKKVGSYSLCLLSNLRISYSHLTL